MKIRNAKDFYAGLLFLGVGAGFAIVASTYAVGTALRMGPGYFPMILGGLLALLGIGIAAGAVSPQASEERVSRWALRPLLLVLAAVCVFAFLVQTAGLVIALLALVVIAALGGHEFKLLEVALLAVALVVIAVGIFVYGLSMPFQLWP